ncbi:8641_t:CDS:2 [Ambispora leptoticha]|uniref:8641_t:CDS:1 n=1 Tax=Ambispora leptoticha TaxID=144679 RepID=A0A9N9F663_9GLOM|nr:8641_t:CDS:2 [Ambispora leptoticha]
MIIANNLVPLDERFNEKNQSNNEAGDETGEQRTHKINLKNNETTKEEYKLKLGDEIAQGMISREIKQKYIHSEPYKKMEHEKKYVILHRTSKLQFAARRGRNLCYTSGPNPSNQFQGAITEHKLQPNF